MLSGDAIARLSRPSMGFCSLFLVSFLLLTPLLCAAHNSGCLGQFCERNGRETDSRGTHNNRLIAQSQVSTSSDLQQSLEQEYFINLLQWAKAEEDSGSMCLADEAPAVTPAVHHADQLTPISQYVGIGYNLLKGNPDGSFESGGIDPGLLTTRRIFEFTYKFKHEDWFMKTIVNVPDQVNFHSVESCSQESKTSIFSGAKSYQKSLTVGGGVSVSVYGFEFGLNSAIEEAKKETVKKKHVYLDSKQVCNLGRVRYLTDRKKIHVLSKSFYNRVTSLPEKYDSKVYNQFIDDWGTHLVVVADVGVKNITRMVYTYTDIFRLLKNQKSGGISFGGKYLGQGGGIKLDMGFVNGNELKKMKAHSQSKHISIGTKENPFPVHLKLERISEALKPQFWHSTLQAEGATYEGLGIAVKKENLEKALKEYEKIATLEDPDIQIDYKWPNGMYALLAPSGNKCPSGWSRGERTQGVGGDIGFSYGITSHVGVDFNTKTITLHYCVKYSEKNDGGIGFEWPKGSYCIARRGGTCPEDGFDEGSITWDDKTTFFEWSRNSNSGKLPDGEYDRNTQVEFCCRKDMSADTPMVLPVAESFVLYQYGSQCQKVANTKLESFYIKFDSNLGPFTKNKCSGEHPTMTKQCKGDHILYLCSYKRI